MSFVKSVTHRTGKNGNHYPYILHEINFQQIYDTKITEPKIVGKIDLPKISDAEHFHLNDIENSFVEIMPLISPQYFIEHIS